MDNKIIKTKIVYIPIEVGDRLPEDSGIYYTDGKRGKDFYKKGNVGFDDDANFWLEPTEAYVFTPDVVDWLLEKHGIWVSVDTNSTRKWLWRINQIELDSFIQNDDFNEDYFNSPKEAYESAFKYTLTELI